MGNHQFVHVELSARDRAEARKFYGTVFGWTFQEFPEMDYTTFDTGSGGMGGGLNPVSETFPGGTVTPYIGTDNIEETLAKITAAGGEVIMPPMLVPDVGDIAIFKDLSGNVMGLLQPSGQ